MQRFYTNSRIAKFLLQWSTCETISIGIFVFSINESLSQVEKNHESIHTAQWVEMFFLFFLFLMCWDVFCDVGKCTYLLSFIFYYLIYGFEFLIRFLFTFNMKKAYENISFEVEAYENMISNTYFENRKLFSWVNFIV